MPPCLVLSLDDPGVRLEPDFLDQTLFHGRFRHGLSRCRRENALDRPAVVIDRLRCRHVEHGIAIEQRNLDEYRAGLFRAAPAHGAEYPLGLAAAQVSCHPYAGFQSHGVDDRPAHELSLVFRIRSLPYVAAIGRRTCWQKPNLLLAVGGEGSKPLFEASKGSTHRRWR